MSPSIAALVGNRRATAQWDHAFSDGAMFKHGNMSKGTYVDPARDFCGIYFGLAPNQEGYVQH